MNPGPISQDPSRSIQNCQIWNCRLKKKNTFTPTITDYPDSKKNRNSLNPALADKKKRNSLIDSDISVDITAVTTRAALKRPVSPEPLPGSTSGTSAIQEKEVSRLRQLDICSHCLNPDPDLVPLPRNPIR